MYSKGLTGLENPLILEGLIKQCYEIKAQRKRETFSIVISTNPQKTPPKQKERMQFSANLWFTLQLEVQ